MDANRFDTLTKALSGGRSRRSALGAAIAGGVLGALGLGGPESTRAAVQENICEPAGDGGLCVVDFQVIVRQGPNAKRALVADGSPGTLRGFLRFNRSATGNLLDADLLLGDGSSLPVVGQISGYGFQARIDIGRGQALVAVGVGEQPLFRCLGRLDGTVTGTELGDLGEWHALAGAQNVPQAAGGGNQAQKSGNRPVSDASGAGSQQANGDTTTRSSSGNATTGDEDNRPVTESNGNQPGSVSSRGNAPGNGGNDRPANDSSANRPVTENNGPDVLEVRQESDPADVVLACPESEARCGNACVNLQTDTGHCGTCDAACPAGQECSDGACVSGGAVCPEGQARCSNACVITDSDVFNCGACGHICALEEDCAAGQCLPLNVAAGCETGQTLCGATCNDLQTDVNNCGACGVACAPDESCVGSACTPAAPPLCPEGQVRCDGICREALTNFGTQGLSCPGGGGIPTECPAGRVLCNGACFPEGACQSAECQPGWGYCYGVCRDFQNDPGYCGGCSVPCTGNAYCDGGRCFGCSSSLTACGKDCVDIKTDLNNCGGCGNLCGTQCINGQCTGVGPTPGCVPGTTRCGDACVDLARDSANCGKCGAVCKPNTECVSLGVCALTEAFCQLTDEHTCGNYCTKFDTHYDCGECGYECTADDYCENGLCYIIGSDSTNGRKPIPPKPQTLSPADKQTLAPADQQTLVPDDVSTCAVGLNTCAGACTDLSSDPLNCGACGNDCGDGAECQQGQCLTPGAAPDEPPLAPVDDASQTETEPADTAPEAEPSSTTCPEGQVECAGACTDLSADPLNCGSCGNVCASGSSCDVGVCAEPPAPVAPEEGDMTAPAEEPAPPIAPDDEAPPLTEPDAETTACAAAGDSCDPGLAGACCSSVCNDDSTCA